jgi:uncharacterized C2H2 Zn-finger protein
MTPGSMPNPSALAVDEMDPINIAALEAGDIAALHLDPGAMLETWKYVILERRSIDMLNTLIFAEFPKDSTAIATMAATAGDMCMFAILWSKGFPISWYSCHTAAQSCGRTEMLYFLASLYSKVYDKRIPTMRCMACSMLFTDSEKYKLHVEEHEKTRKAENARQKQKRDHAIAMIPG